MPEYYYKNSWQATYFSLITFSFFNNLLLIFLQKVWEVGKLPHFLFALTSCLYQFPRALSQTSWYLSASCLLGDIKSGFFILPGSSPGFLHTPDSHPRLSHFCCSGSFHVWRPISFFLSLFPSLLSHDPLWLSEKGYMIPGP